MGVLRGGRPGPTGAEQAGRPGARCAAWSNLAPQELVGRGRGWWLAFSPACAASEAVMEMTQRHGKAVTAAVWLCGGGDCRNSRPPRLPRSPSPQRPLAPLQAAPAPVGPAPPPARPEPGVWTGKGGMEGGSTRPDSTPQCLMGHCHLSRRQTRQLPGPPGHLPATDSAAWMQGTAGPMMLGTASLHPCSQEGQQAGAVRRGQRQPLGSGGG